MSRKKTKKKTTPQQKTTIKKEDIMTTQAFQVQSPEQFNFSTPTEWPRWKKKFERFRTVSGLVKQDESAQIEMLMYLMGDKSDDIFRTFKFQADDDKKKLDKVLEQFDNYFCSRRNVIYERALFNSRIQEEGEPVEDFITALYKLAEYCDYKDLHDEMIRDRIVVGVKNKQLSEKLQLDTALTLEKAVSMARQSEAVKKQQQEIQGRPPSPKVNRVGAQAEKKKSHQTGKRQEKNADSPKNEDKCGRCGFTHWKGKTCPAKEATCRKCDKIGHFEKCCRTKNSKQKEDNPAGVKQISKEDNEDAFMFALSSEKKEQRQRDREKRWTDTISVNGKKMEFRLDSAADVVCIPMRTFRQEFKHQQLEIPDRRLKAADNDYLDCIGMFQARLKFRNTEIEENAYVVRALERPLLSLSACEDLQLITRVRSVKQETTLSSVEPEKEFPELFCGLGEVGSPYQIKLKENSKPYAVHSPRRIPIPLREKLQTRLEELLKLGIIKEVNEATDWCAPTVITGKPNGDIRLCVDLSKLNQNLDREIHPMPVVEHTLGQLGGAKYFSKLDANSGFHQIRLTEESQLLTTFITPFGRFCFRRLPFGISTAPEVYQKTMQTILRGIDGVICYFDDILIFAENIEDHDEILKKVLSRLKKAKVTLNSAKCVFGKTEINFLGHIINEEGIKPDPKKIEAVTNMPQPRNATEVRRFMGFVNHLGRFIPHLSDEAAPLNQLLCNEQDFVWGPSQDRAFQNLKKALSEHPTLAAYDVKKNITVSSDASSYGLGTVLKQEQDDGSWKPVAYASRTMTDSEKRYAQIEKEALALTWACERFADFLVGKSFKIETDHKPLVPIFSTKDMDVLTPRLQRFRMRMLRFQFEIYHTPGKDLIAADTLSRHPLPQSDDAENEEMTAAHINAVLSCLPTTDERLTEIFKAQQEDSTMKKIDEFSMNGWPEKKKVDPDCVEYWNVRHEIGNQNGLLMRGCRIIIPKILRSDILTKIHAGHLGIAKSRARARESVWWPGISNQIEDMIKKCNTCIEEATPKHEPLIPSDFPTRPWQKIAMDLCYYQKKWYLVVVDYYSRYPEVVQLQHLTAALIVNVCKSIFARHGIPEIVVSDNGTQFGDPIRNFHPGASRDFARFAVEYGFKHVTSSPKFPQSNGMAEAAVKVVKNLFKKNKDPSLALMEYRATPLSNGYSPAELLMGRKIRTTLPAAPGTLSPKTVEEKDLRRKEEEKKMNQKKNYDKRHGVKEKPDLESGDTVWISDMRIWGKVTGKAPTPRSYIVETPRGIIRRNRFHLTKGSGTVIPEPEEYPVDADPQPDRINEEQREIPVPEPDAPPYEIRNDGQRRTRSGRVIKPVSRYPN